MASAAGSLPLDSAGWLARDVEDHPVDLRYLVGDAGADPGDDVVGEAGPVGRHRVLARHRAEHDRMPVRAAVALDADRPNVSEEHHGELPDRAVQPSGGQPPPGEPA